MSASYSVFLPKTYFDMKGNLAQKEPLIRSFWSRINLYEKLRKNAQGKPPFMLHFGPPYANGHTHMGHALTYILKDIVVKTYQMKGFDAPCVPGWDCHGLPIEWKIEEHYRLEKKKKENVHVLDFIKECRSFAIHWIEVQKLELERFGLLADFKNPYITMSPMYESSTLKQLYDFLMKGRLYRGFKPVLWSVVEKTALAEAEVEYNESHISDSIYVAFKVIESKDKKLEGAFVVIWTTTPWTIPANRAIAFDSNASYALVTVLKTDSPFIQEKKRLLIAQESMDETLGVLSVQDYSVEKVIEPGALDGCVCEHPFSGKGYDFKVPLLPANHVDTKSGTGFVHTAPSHGLEDFELGKAHNLDITEIVQGDGTYSESTPLFAGNHIYKVNPLIIEELKVVSALAAHSKITHSYPYSWRSKTPLIYRATPQWFIDLTSLKEEALAAIDQVKWHPHHGMNRIRSMVENREQWCLSRQRIWGVPIALFIHKETQKPLLDERVNNRVVDAFAKEGMEAWHRYDTSFFLEGLYDPNLYEKIYDIADVWFDSGCTHTAVLKERGLSFPADLYMEGSDQHRGWFQSSLLTSIHLHGCAPYKTIVTHGFLLDEKGRKMSKSLGNTCSPSDVIDKSGADLLRLWVVNSDYQEDIRFGFSIMKHQEDVYRRFRNTLRYLLGALCDYDDNEVIPYDELPKLEKWILHHLYALDQLHQECVSTYLFQRFYSALHNFCSVELSSLYFDIRKDTLYCDVQTNPKRRSVRFVMNEVIQYLIRWLAPVLSFTAEEAYQIYKNKKLDWDNCEQSVHELFFLTPPLHWKKDDIDKEFKQLSGLRGEVLKQIETLREAKIIGSSLQTHVGFCATGELPPYISDLDWSEFVISSSFSFQRDSSQGIESLVIPGLFIHVEKKEGVKCPRCWKIVDAFDVSKEVLLCRRCESTL